MKRLKEDSQTFKKLTDAEHFLDNAGICIIGHHLRVQVDGVELHIGRDCDQFPRFADEPFTLE